MPSNKASPGDRPAPPGHGERNDEREQEGKQSVAEQLRARRRNRKNSRSQDQAKQDRNAFSVNSQHVHAAKATLASSIRCCTMIAAASTHVCRTSPEKTLRKTDRRAFA